MTDVKKLYPNFLTLDDALALDKKTATEMTLKHLNQYRTQLAIDLGAATYVRKAEGCHFWDENGDKHLDFIGDVGVYALGLNNPFILDNVKKYLDQNLLTMDPLTIRQITSSFAHNMALITPELTRTVVVGGGGMEANETVLKMVTIAAHRTKKGKTRMLTTLNSFHGKSAACVNLGGKPKWREWQDTLPNFSYVPYGDLAAAEAELAKGDVIAFMAETIQGEGGIVVPPEDYFPGIRKLCDKYDAYMVMDEVQAGTSRTGNIWAWQYYGNFVPDAFTFAKAISNGILPAGGVQAKDELYLAAYGSYESAFHHTATFQDNQISACVMLASLQFILENDVPAKARETGAYLIGKLNELKAKYPGVIDEVRGRGFMLGIKFKANSKGEYYTVPISGTLANKYKVHTLFSINDETINRFYPNYFSTQEDFDWFLNGLENSIKDVLAQMGE